MALTYKVLAQANPLATTNTVLYTCPASTSVVLSSIVVCNQNASGGAYRIAIRPNDETLVAKHYIAFDRVIAGNATETHTIGITMDAADKITIYASSATMSFNAFGVEIQ
jgi:hypothetical protein